MELRAANIIDQDIEGHYAFFPFVEEISTREHQHDFYEIFLITKGMIQHHINGDTQHLSQGTLVFIRPLDAHYFSKYGDDNCELLNIAFLQRTYSDVSDFIGQVLCQDNLLDNAMPPQVSLTIAEIQSLMTRLKRWGRALYQDKMLSRSTLRGILAHVIGEIFLSHRQQLHNNIPQWLVDVCDAMQQRDNIIDGRDALMRLAQRSPEYVGRSFQSYLNITPSQFINDLRLDYASDLLLHTNESPTDIAFEVGFGNVSHFYHLFKERWACSPLQFRKQNQQTLLP